MSGDDGSVVPSWGEGEPARFIRLGRVYTPDRDQLLEAFLDLIPAEDDEPFTGVELGSGSGWLNEGILKHFSHSTMIGRDASGDNDAADTI